MHLLQIQHTCKTFTVISTSSSELSSSAACLYEFFLNGCPGSSPVILIINLPDLHSQLV